MGDHMQPENILVNSPSLQQSGFVGVKKRVITNTYEYCRHSPSHTHTHTGLKHAKYSLFFSIK